MLHGDEKKKQRCSARLILARLSHLMNKKKGKQVQKVHYTLYFKLFDTPF